MKKKGIKNVIFDFGGVLMNLDRQRCMSSFKALGLKNVDKFLDPTDENGAYHLFEKGMITVQQFREEIRKEIGNEVTNEAIDDAWNSYLVGVPKEKLDLLLKLRESYVVYLLSNTNELHWEWSCQYAFPYRGFRVEDYFEKMYLSFELKDVKPSTEVFSRILVDANIDPKETLFIDDIQENCEAAASLGLQVYQPQPKEDLSKIFNR